MSVDLLTKINGLAALSDGQRWFLEPSHQIVIKEKNQLPQNRIRLFLSGNNSLANTIQQISKELQTASQLQNKEMDAKTSAIVGSLQTLREKVATKIKKYNESHGWLYKLFMRIIGRDIDVAKRSFDAVCSAIKSVNKAIPIDRTQDLESLTKHHQFSKLGENAKFAKISIYIHMLALAQPLNVSYSELANLLMSKDFGRDDIPAVSLELFKLKKGWTLPNDAEKMLELLDHYGLASFYYHGTNTFALKTICEHGLGSSKRDYDPEFLSNLGIIPQTVTGFKTSAFYVSGLPDFSYGYANRSPEWLWFAKGKFHDHVSASDRTTFEATRKKYESTTEIALLQIQMKHVPDEARRKVNIEFAQKNDAYDFAYKNFICFQGVNEKIENANFDPVKVVYYMLPKLTVRA